MVREVDPTEQLDEEVEEMLLQLADDFVETTVNAACLLAKHRHANTVEVKDVQLHLGKLISELICKKYVVEMILEVLRVCNIMLPALAKIY